MKEDKIICKCHGISKKEIKMTIITRNVSSLKDICNVFDVKIKCEKCKKKIEKLRNCFEF
ncbi:MAG TPA: hypothetical protein DEH02_18350 [Bacteroidales bacterium]|nr:MAG: hypothetical protein A2X01_17170 [Bacteroidetes bacterium GWF2_35_48]OFY96621.1 MAG: hypothetical protein A2491_02970 [Bacteroidetes bacterium RIFOXYC12_FULL_35_7]HBX53032.1 hypothetical protein [Bacteroidales bacterium]